MTGISESMPVIRRDEDRVAELRDAGQLHGARARGQQMRLRLQDQPILQHLQMIGAERRAGGGDVDDQLGGAGGGRGLGRADALDDAVAGDAVARRRSAASDSYIWSRRGGAGHARRANCAATSSRSAMRATSIQQSGTATTTSARPKPSGARNSTVPSTSASVSRIRSSPVTPR